MPVVLTDLQKAIYQTLEYCLDEHGKSQMGYFSPNGWAGAQLLKALPEREQKFIRELYT